MASYWDRHNNPKFSRLKRVFFIAFLTCGVWLLAASASTAPAGSSLSANGEAIFEVDLASAASNRSLSSVQSILAQAPEANIEIKDPVFNDNSTPLYAIISLLISSIAAPVIVTAFTNRQNQGEKSLNYAWKTAEETQKQLQQAKDDLIVSLKAEVDGLRKELEIARDATDQAQQRALVCETEVRVGASERRRLSAESVVLTNQLRQCNDSRQDSHGQDSG